MDQQQQIDTRQFRPDLTPEQIQIREDARRAATRRRNVAYRERLRSKRIPELRNMAEACLAAFVSMNFADHPEQRLTREFLARIRDAGFDPVATLDRAKELRRKVRLISSNA